jgi:hypothetical protein
MHLRLSFNLKTLLCRLKLCFEVTNKLVSIMAFVTRVIMTPKIMIKTILSILENFEPRTFIGQGKLTFVGHRSPWLEILLYF